ncbi:MAG: sigma-70 family RNA polymerase sigma factor [Planctomycetota bacterium]
MTAPANSPQPDQQQPDPQQQTDDRLAERLAAGDEQALADAFALHAERLQRAVVFRLDPRLRSRVDAQDVLQEAYLQASSRLGHFAKQRDADAEAGRPLLGAFLWLRLIVNQALVDVHRRHLGAQQRDAGREVNWRRPGQGAGVATSVSLADCLLGHLTSPSHAAMREELGDKLRDAVSTMSELDQEVIALRHFEQLTNGEVAHTLGIEVKAASIRYVRAIKRLKEVLDTVPGFGGLELLLR